MTFASGGGSLRNGKVSIPRSIGQWAPRDGDGGGPATNRFFGSGRRNREKETYLRTSVRGRPRAHSRTLARNTQHLRLLRGSLRGERVLRGGRDAQSVRPSVRRSAAAREGPFSVSVAIVGFVVVITIVGADKAEQIEERRRGELQKRNEAVRGRTQG